MNLEEDVSAKGIGSPSALRRRVAACEFRAQTPALTVLLVNRVIATLYTVTNGGSSFQSTVLYFCKAKFILYSDSSLFV